MFIKMEKYVIEILKKIEKYIKRQRNIDKDSEIY